MGSTALPHIVLIRVTHFIVNSHEPESPVVLLNDEIIKLIQQALVTKAVVSKDNVLCVQLHLVQVITFHSVAYGLEPHLQRIHFCLPFCYPVIGVLLILTVIGNFDLDALDEKLHEPQGKCLNLIFVVLCLSYHGLKDIIREDLVIIYIGVAKGGALGGGGAHAPPKNWCAPPCAPPNEIRFVHQNISKNILKI